MRTLFLKVAVVALLIVMLMSSLPAAAATPPEDPNAPEVPTEGAASSPATEASAPEPLWVPSGATPGFYAARDNRNLDPAEYGLVGGHQSFYWDDLEPNEGNYQWWRIDNFIAAQVSKGKKAAFGIITYNSRPTPTNPMIPVRVPAWVFAAGARKITCNGYDIPKYWDPIYLQKYRNFIAALAARYDGDARIEFIQIGVGKYGETQPCDDSDDACVKAALVADGKSEWTWPYIVNDITDIYADNFHQTKLLLPNAPRFYSEGDRQIFTDHAIERGVGLFPAGVYADLAWVDLRTKPNWNGYGKYDRILDKAGTDQSWVPVAFETYEYMTPDPTSFFWGVAGALSRRADYMTAERTVLYRGAPDDSTVTPITENIAVIRWASKYLGKHLNNTPSVWVLLRASGHQDTMYPQKGNYSFWLEQDDSISQGRTKPTTYRAASELPDPGQSPNPEVETGQTFLQNPDDDQDPNDPIDVSPSRMGWICRRTDAASGNPYMWFKIDDRYRNLYGSTNQATVTVYYFDRGTDTWQLVYDAVGNANKVARVITKTNSNRWEKATFTLTDARFQNGQTGGADFRIDAMSGDEYIHMVDVKMGGSSSGEVYELNLTTANGGWNFVSTPIIPQSTNTADVLAGISGKYDLVQAYYGGVWREYPGAGDLTTIDHTRGFWIHMTQSANLTITGNAPSSTTLSLAQGWNMIGWPSNDTRSITTALASIAGKYTVVYGYNASDSTDPWKMYAPALPSYANDLTHFSPGKAYWIYMTSAASLVVDY